MYLANRVAGSVAGSTHRVTVGRQLSANVYHIHSGRDECANMCVLPVLHCGAPLGLEQSVATHHLHAETSAVPDGQLCA